MIFTFVGHVISAEASRNFESSNAPSSSSSSLENSHVSMFSASSLIFSISVCFQQKRGQHTLECKFVLERERGRGGGGGGGGGGMKCVLGRSTILLW
ncbi:hypothetical protein Hanom_Chr10g00965511 [Helianthus anomalus]